jgi:hypothetical protein
MNRPLVEIVAQMALFLEQADDSTVGLDAAVKQQEEMAFRLQRLSPEERLKFIEILEEITAENPFEDQRRILRELPKAVGIAP